MKKCCDGVAVATFPSKTGISLVAAAYGAGRSTISQAGLFEIDWDSVVEDPAETGSNHLVVFVSNSKNIRNLQRRDLVFASFAVSQPMMVGPSPGPCGDPLQAQIVVQQSPPRTRSIVRGGQ
jgi:hypothetical protein